MVRWGRLIEGRRMLMRIDLAEGGSGVLPCCLADAVMRVHLDPCVATQVFLDLLLPL